MTHRNQKSASVSSVQSQLHSLAEGASEDAGYKDCLGDPQITKSPNDRKHYRYVGLNNGLRALLISECSIADEEGGQQECEEQTEEEETWKKEYSDDPDSHDGCKIKHGNVTSEKLSAAALCIGVGSFSDPADLPGLAHLLEHMVFMGSEKYPEENGFDAFLKKHGGSSNASTDCERTVFLFDVQRKHFREALDRWAQFFICPLMIKDTIDREVEAVDSEYQLARPSDSHRRRMLFGSLAKPNHPMGNFCWGNAEALKHGPMKNKINIYEQLWVFWRRHYSAHYMTLAVQSKETLDTLEQWIREIFSNIPNNGQPKPDFSHLLEPFDTPAYNKLYRVVPVKKFHALNITWALPPQGKQYRVKPLHYISWLVCHEGPGSVLSLLRKKCWALALFGGNSETGFDQNSTYSVFCISITLTDRGFENVYEVVHIVFQYLKMLQTVGPQQRIYEEIQNIESIQFKYQEEVEPINYVEIVCENIQLFSKEDFLTGNQLMFQYKPEVISAALTLLTPDKANLMLLSPEHEGCCLLKENWFGVQYSIEDIRKECREQWTRSFELERDLYLPEENMFIATDFILKTSDCTDTDLPVKIISDARGCVWFKKDTKFKIPKGHVHFHLLSPVIQESPENLVLFDVFVNILAHNLAEPAYGAEVAQLEYRLVAGEHGLVIEVKGFSHKLPLLFKLIVDHLADFSVAPHVCDMYVEQVKKAYFNILINPRRLGKNVQLCILEHHRWSMLQKYRAVVKGLGVAEVLAFACSLKSELYAEGLVQGNFTSLESKEFLHYIIEKLQFRPLTAEVPVLFRVVKLPQQWHLCKVRSFSEEDATSEVTVYYQCGLKNLREHALVELLIMLMEEPCFHFLRSKETLGYEVFPTYRNTSGVLGFSITVETQANRFNTDLVEIKIEEFLVSFEEQLTSLTAEAFEAQVTALIKLKECEDSHLGEEVERNWSEVLTQQYLFDRLNREVSALKLITKAELLSWFTEYRCTNCRKLSVHVVGFGEEESDPRAKDSSDVTFEHSTEQGNQKTSSHERLSKLNFLPASPVMAGATVITDIRAFTSSLTLHPYHKVLR